MKNIGWFSRFLMQPTPACARARARRATGAAAAALLLVAAGYAGAQDAASAALPVTASQMSIPAGYTAHTSVDMGGRMSNINGSGAMYNTLVNLHSGPRVLGVTFDLHVLPTTKHSLVDNLTTFTTGFGGQPYNFAKLDATKGNIYEFSGDFRRDRRYFDYDLLGNPGIPAGSSIPIAGSTSSYAWPQVNSSPFLFNTVRRMTNANLILHPLSKVTFRFSYAQNIFQGPSLTPSGNAVSGQEVILQEYQRNSTDDFFAAIDWKPVQGTKLSYEEQVDHYKGDSYFTIAPNYLNVLEADGTKVSLLTSYMNFMPYGYSATGVYTPRSVCSSSVGASILYANPNGGLPIIDPACYVISRSFRSQPTREVFPTEIIRFQSTSLKNVQMNGNIRYTKANMNLPDYYEQFQGLSATTRETDYTGLASAKRDVIAVDYGIIWRASDRVSLSDQVSYSRVHQPGSAEFLSGTTVSVTSGADTITNVTGLTSKTVSTGAGPFGHSGPPIGAPQFNFFGQKYVINNATVTWYTSPRATLALTYRYGKHTIDEGAPNATAPRTGEELFYITENGGIFNASVRPTNNWDLNGSVELLYHDNVFTPVGPRRTEHYRIHTIYRPKSWATFSGVFNDMEQKNNTNNTGTPSAVGPLDHVFHSRVVSLGTVLTPTAHYGVDLDYTYSEVYTATNICFQGAAGYLPGGAIAPAAANATGQLCGPVSAGHGSNNVLFLGRDFQDAPTQFLSAALAWTPVERLHSDIGYRMSNVNGSRFFTDASDVNGSTVSDYQTPFVSVAWTVHKGFIWKGEYNYYGYGEGGRSGAQYCNVNPGLAVGTAGPVPVVPCSSVANTAMSSGTPVYGQTAPRDFHANNLLLGFHYEF